MPVIRPAAAAPPLKSEDRAAMVERLRKEVDGAVTERGPVIFEIPLPEPDDRIDVLVVWDEWQDRTLAGQTRSGIILDAYQGSKAKVAEAIGVTYQEAIDKGLLPYAVVPMARTGETSPEALREVMRRNNAFAHDNGRFDLRFPTEGMALEAHRRLTDEYPKGYWSIVYTINPGA